MRAKSANFTQCSKVRMARGRKTNRKLRVNAVRVHIVCARDCPRNGQVGLRKSLPKIGQVGSIRRLMQAFGAGREDLAPRLGNPDRMFELRRKRPIARYRRPAIVEPDIIAAR